MRVPPPSDLHPAECDSEDGARPSPISIPSSQGWTAPELPIVWRFWEVPRMAGQMRRILGDRQGPARGHKDVVEGDGLDIFSREENHDPRKSPFWNQSTP